jgi:hypothetical protein
MTPDEETPCPRCEGKGYICVEYSHKMELRNCPVCNPGFNTEMELLRGKAQQGR